MCLLHEQADCEPIEHALTVYILSLFMNIFTKWFAIHDSVFGLVCKMESIFAITGVCVI